MSWNKATFLFRCGHMARQIIRCIHSFIQQTFMNAYYVFSTLLEYFEDVTLTSKN